MNWHIFDPDQVLEKLGTSLKGLTRAQAQERLREYGPNELTQKEKVTVFQLLYRQFADLMIVVLLIAAILSGLLGDIHDTFIILAIVILNASAGFIQEYRSEKAIEALQRMASQHAVVLRDGIRITINGTELVPGDVINLEAGNIVPADIRLTAVHRLKVVEASLTGESVAVEKNSEALKEEDAALGDRINMAYKGTVADYGRATGVVVATGMKTEIGKIAGMLQTADQITPLQKRFKTFSKQLAWVVLLICVIIFITGFLGGEDIWSMLLTSISLAVAAMPEALPAVITITLALGARQMARHHALIRSLPAVETLGSVTYICSDKTGTLTLNKMRVQELFDGKQRHSVYPVPENMNSLTMDTLFKGMALNNDVSEEEEGKTIGESTEIALYEFAKTIGFRKSELLTKYPRIAELPFDAARKCMTTVHRMNGKYMVIVKGALDVLIHQSTSVDESANNLWINESEHMASEGLRVLGFGYKMLDELPEVLEHRNLESGLTLSGIVGISDPPREEAANAVRECKEAGITPVMITGDHLLTAQSIARKLGIIETGNDLGVTGKQLSGMTSGELLEKVSQIRVYARVSPEEKLMIIKALQEGDQLIAMTGDGANDAPSLKSADIGISMGITGTDVAREASDMILLDDNFATIVDAVRQGRRIYDNIRKFIRYILTGNSGEVWTIFLAPFFGLPVPLLAIHILWINLVSDGLPAIALAMEPAEQGIMKRPPRPQKESIFAGGLGLHILLVGLLIGILCLVTQYIGIKNEISAWQTMVFTVLCFSQMAHVLAIRSERIFLFRQGLFSNPWLLASIALTVLLQLIIIYLPPANMIFKTQPLTMVELALCFGISAIVFHVVELEKWLRSRISRVKIAK